MRILTLVLPLFVFSFSIVSILASPGVLAVPCTPTPHRTTGTHYKPVTVHKVDVGKGIVVEGRILSAKDCKPIPGAKIAHWQAGESGRYEDRFYAYLYAGKAGKYRFRTEWPNLRPPHIHFSVTAAGFRKTETQWIGDSRRKRIVFNIVLQPAGK